MWQPSHILQSHRSSDVAISIGGGTVRQMVRDDLREYLQRRKIASHLPENSSLVSMPAAQADRLAKPSNMNTRDDVRSSSARDSSHVFHRAAESALPGAPVESAVAPNAPARHHYAESLEDAILSVLKAKPLSPAGILNEVSQRKNLLLSQKRIGIAINELAKQGLIRMLAPALYTRAR